MKALVSSSLFLSASLILLAGAFFSCSAPSPTDAMSAEWESSCRQEVVELHQFFADWFHGNFADPDQAFSRFRDVMAEDFVIQPPEGEPMDRASILERVRSAFGMRSESGTSMRIWIENARLVRIEGDAIHFDYEEWQELDGQSRGRQSKAVFRPRVDTPHGVEWVSVHETWLD